MEGSVSLDAIRAAREATATVVRVTPTWPSITLGRVASVPVLLKCEQMQRTGSFKIRGAANFVHALAAKGPCRGLIAASAGNHAQGIALAGAEAGLPVTVVMPVTAPLAKVSGARGYGATVVLAGGSLEEARAEAVARAEAGGLTYVPPFDDGAIIAGQGTLGLELLEQAPGVTEVLVPAGGGGLLAGVATAIKAVRPAVKVIGVQAAAMDGIRRSLAAGAPVAVPSRRTVADGVAVAGPSERTFALIAQHADAVVAVGEDAIARAIVLLLERAKMVVEGAGALGVAALLSGAWKPAGPTVIVLSGGNIDINLLGSVVRRGLADAGRYQHLAIEVSDTPGELALVTAAIATAGGNILEVDHDREARGMPVGVAILRLVVEVNGPEHFAMLVAGLRESGLREAPGGSLATEGALRRHEQQ